MTLLLILYLLSKRRAVFLLQEEQEAHVFSPCCIKHQKSSVLSWKQGTLQLVLEWPVTSSCQCNLQAPQKRTGKSAFLVALSPRCQWQQWDPGPGMSGMCIPGLFWRCRADKLSCSSLRNTLISQSWSSALEEITSVSSAWGEPSPDLLF